MHEDMNQKMLNVFLFTDVEQYSNVIMTEPLQRFYINQHNLSGLFLFPQEEMWMFSMASHKNIESCIFNRKDTFKMTE